VLLIEVDMDARAKHEHALRAGGYTVQSAACPEQTEVDQAAVVLADVPSFHWLRETARHLPPTLVVTNDEKAGVTACLCGADAWAPVASDDGYLIAAVDGVLRDHGL
jgi:hypothetical protein